MKYSINQLVYVYHEEFFKNTWEKYEEVGIITWMAKDKYYINWGWVKASEVSDDQDKINSILNA